MANKFLSGVYTPTNSDKYKGDKLPQYRSSWEFEFMKMLDFSEGVLSWASEPFPIPYMNPLTGRQTVYIPDFLVTLISGGQPITKLIEIKPLHQTFESHANSKMDQAIQARNQAKWGAAAEWCQRHAGAIGMPCTFEIYTEADMFSGGKAILPSARNLKPINFHGTRPKKRQAKKPTSILENLKKRANKLKAAQNKQGRLSTSSPKVRKARVARVGKVKRS